MGFISHAFGAVGKGLVGGLEIIGDAIDDGVDAMMDVDPYVTGAAANVVRGIGKGIIKDATHGSVLDRALNVGDDVLGLTSLPYYAATKIAGSAIAASGLDKDFEPLGVWSRHRGVGIMDMAGGGMLEDQAKSLPGLVFMPFTLFEGVVDETVDAVSGNKLSDQWKMSHQPLHQPVNGDAGIPKSRVLNSHAGGAKPPAQADHYGKMWLPVVAKHEDAIPPVGSRLSRKVFGSELESKRDRLNTRFADHVEHEQQAHWRREDGLKEDAHEVHHHKQAPKVDVRRYLGHESAHIDRPRRHHPGGAIKSLH